MTSVPAATMPARLVICLLCAARASHARWFFDYSLAPVVPFYIDALERPAPARRSRGRSALRRRQHRVSPAPARPCAHAPPRDAQARRPRTAADQAAARGVDAGGLGGSCLAAAAHAALEVDAPAERGEQRKASLGQGAGRLVVASLREAIEQGREHRVRLGFGRARRRGAAHPGQRLARGLHRGKALQNLGARHGELRLDQREELGAGALVELDRQRVHRLERAAEALAALARRAGERADLAELLRQQGEHQIRVAVLHATQQQRVGYEPRRPGATPRGSRGAGERQLCARAADSSAACRHRGLDTMLSANVNKISSSTNATATPSRRPRAGLVGAEIGSGVTHATRREAV